ncbi:MAG: phosphoesterase, partial [Deltaproteobacteria bacterium]|nr:phosphoesterase [Deltaproteobacteria bacterium]
VQSKLTPLYQRHLEVVELVRSRARLESGVVFYDVGDQDVGALNKFISYDLFPQARYAVSVSRHPSRAKISVGSNPWAREKRTHDLARLCERYGGGGHPVVGAVSFPADELEKARRVAQEIVGQLKG